MTMPIGYTADPLPITQGPPTDLTQANDEDGPGNVEVVWTLPRDFEVDLQTVLQAAFTHYEILDVPVIINGVFEAAMLRKPDPTDPTNVQKGTIVPIVVINLTSDVGTRTSLGEITMSQTAPSPSLADGIPGAIDPVLEAGQQVTLKNQASRVAAAISIYCLDEQLAKATYLFTKTDMFAAESTFQSLGYIEPPMRTSASRSTNLLDFDGGAKFVFEWDMTYEGMHYDFIAGIDSLAELIAVRSEISSSLDPDGQATQTAEFTTVAT